ncbi:trypsin-like peptidase domain-containing protein [Fodinicola acaciae]|uniref:trypsin-like peptidase domain-containing protein n=1 Tax=Fodinicola acaciae TaxID=2681555 RepID=UPI0013D24F6C|nr:trypsin-like peptidase domain-containing protein [Fodinicola acaciae]
MRRILGIAAMICGLTAATVMTAPTAASAVLATDFHGIVALSNCSGSVVKPPTAAATDPALVLTNGHCLETGMPRPGQVITNQSSSRTFSLLSKDGQSRLGTLRARKVIYSTMTNTDVTLYQLTTTYQQIQQTYGISALNLPSTHPTAGARIDVVSGYWRTIYSCGIDGFAYELHEADWIFKDSIRYTSACHVIGGTSGSPIVESSTGNVVGVNNTTNEDGERCTLNNPCEVDAAGNVTVRRGIGYGQETYIIPGCLKAGNEIDLTKAGCTLPRP